MIAPGFRWQAVQSIAAASAPAVTWAVCAPTETSVVAVRPFRSLGGAPVSSVVPPWQAVQALAEAPSPPWSTVERAWPQPATRPARAQTASEASVLFLMDKIPSPPRILHAGRKGDLIWGKRKERLPGDR